MKIGEIATAAGVTTSRIRFYERQGIIPSAERGVNGYRDYAPDLIALLRFIEQAQGLGFSLKEIASIEIRTGEHIVSCTDALAMLAEKHKSITALIAEARDRKARIEALMAELQRNKDAADSAI
ncbi:MerR family transcriptional regulator [Paracoccus fistulariae]|uniref:MerR family transcriptional regulator n=1 Tax=Paracoccus fistulariae TaxID=658446 RepID=A0ABY7SKI9_9RHOB|nr:MerR family transcriptional regulator [Paracoccus fistulariae]MDB6181320.1 MerR family transcriptional regulator [Paracoccus fistulariae]WCR07369.1 MerR family transcriptional regulator [Paracoccus fistulariae]